MKLHHTAAELAGLLGLPATERGTRRVATREGWPGQQRAGSKATEYPLWALPAVAQAALVAREWDGETPPREVLERLAPAARQELAKQILAAGSSLPPAASEGVAAVEGELEGGSPAAAPDTLPATAKGPSPQPSPRGRGSKEMVPSPGGGKEIAPRSATLASLTDRQKRRMDARLVILRELERLEETLGGLNKAIAALLQSAAEGSLGERVAAALPLATGGALSRRTLLRWRVELRQGGVAAVAPAARGFDAAEPVWAQAFLAVYRRRSRPSIHQTLRELEAVGTEPLPSYHQAARWLRSLPVAARMKGRVDRHALRAVLPHRRRDTSSLQPMEIIAGDGHTFYALARHPESGRPFAPEITEIMDVATRRHLGYSMGLSESSEVVIDALRAAIETGGVPATLQWDRGSGAKNRMIEGEVTGLADRLGFGVYHPAPGNPRANPAERLHQSVLIPAAKVFKTFVGRRAKHPELLREVAAGLRGGRITPPALDDVAVAIDREIARYNGAPHKGLPMIRDPRTGQRRHQTPDEAWAAALAMGWQPTPVADLLDELRPEVQRTVDQGEVRHANLYYFAAELTPYHGHKVRVRYDLRDGRKVWVYRLDGAYICAAAHAGNRQGYHHASVLEANKVKRADAAIKLAGKRIDRIRDDNRTTIDAQPVTAEVREIAAATIVRMERANQPAAPVVVELEDGRPYFHNDDDFLAWMVAHPDRVTDTDREYIRRLLGNPAFRQLQQIKGNDLEPLRALVAA